MLVSGCASACPLPSDPVSQAASLTKPVIAFAALKLVSHGLLDLRAPVSRYLPEGYAHRQKPFSGEGHVLLQAVISAVAGQDIESFMSTTVFEPLGMRSTRLRTTDDIRERVVDGTSSFGGRVRFDLTEPNAAASLYTTAGDYAKLMAALLATPSLLALTVADPVPVDTVLGLAWGHGWGIETAVGGPYLWQWGNNPGFRAFAMVSVASGNGFVLLTNSERGMPLAAPLARATVPADHGVFRFRMLG